MADLSENADPISLTVQSKKKAGDLELLFRSRGIPFSCSRNRGIWKFRIPGTHADFARNEISLFEEENRPETEAFLRDVEKPFAITPSHGTITAALIFFHFFIQSYPNSRLWIINGRVSAESVLNGEWARTITALTLHGDEAHLLSNCAVLWIFVSGVGQLMGNGIAWLIVLISGASGNFLNSLFYQSAHNSIGASTAVFGGLGIMAGFRIKRELKRRISFKKKFLPIAAALGIVAMLGTGPQSDVMAHFFGFLSGLGIGFILKFIPERDFAKNKHIQIIAFLIFGILIFLSWKIQLTS